MDCCAARKEEFSHSKADRHAVEAAIRATSFDTISLSPIACATRVALLDELEAAGARGLTVLKKNGGLDAILERNPSISDASAVQQTNALRDEYVSDGLVSADVFACGALSRRWLPLGDARVSFRRADGAVLRTDFLGNPYMVYLGQRRLTILAFLLIAGLVVFIAVTTPLPSLSLWVYNSIPPTLALVGELALVVMYIVALIVTGLASTRKARNLNQRLESTEGSLPTLLPVLLDPTVPRFMVSYSWVGGFQTTARTLARALPECWLDTRQLLSGDHIPTETTTIAAHTSCLILFLTPSYLLSPNCCAEIVAALLFRTSKLHVTVAVMDSTSNTSSSVGGGGGAIGREDEAKIRSLLNRAGVVVLNSTLALICFLDLHVLHGNPIELKRTVAWWRKHSRPRTRIPPSLVLMSPQERRRGRRISFCGPRAHGTGSVVAGADRISGDCSEIGIIMRVTSQQKAALICIVLTACCGAYPFLLCWIPDQEYCRRSSAFFWGPDIVILTLAITAFQMMSGLDARQLHDPILLPLNIAAYINEDKGSKKLLGSFSVVFLMPDVVPFECDVAVSNLKVFLQDIAVGIPCSEEKLSNVAHRIIAASDAAVAYGRRIRGEEEEEDTGDGAVATIPTASAASPSAARAGSKTNVPSAAASSSPTASRPVPSFASPLKPLTVYVFMLLDAPAVQLWASAVRADAARIEAVAALAYTSADLPRASSFTTSGGGALSRLSRGRYGGDAETSANAAAAASQLQLGPASAASATGSPIPLLPGRRPGTGGGGDSSIWASSAASSASPASAVFTPFRRHEKQSERRDAHAASAISLASTTRSSSGGGGGGGGASGGSLMTQSVIVCDRSVFSVHSVPSLGQHMCLVRGEKEGIDSASPYPSLAKAILDSLGRKVGAVLAAGRGDAPSSTSAVSEDEDEHAGEDDVLLHIGLIGGKAGDAEGGSITTTAASGINSSSSSSSSSAGLPASSSSSSSGGISADGPPRGATKPSISSLAGGVVGMGAAVGGLSSSTVVAARSLSRSNSSGDVGTHQSMTTNGDSSASASESSAVNVPQSARGSAAAPAAPPPSFAAFSSSTSTSAAAASAAAASAAAVSGQSRSNSTAATVPVNPTRAQHAKGQQQQQKHLENPFLGPSAYVSSSSAKSIISVSPLPTGGRTDTEWESDHSPTERSNSNPLYTAARK